MIIFLSIVLFFITNIGQKVEKEQEEVFLNTVAGVRASLSGGISDQYLDNLRAEGYTVIVYDTKGNTLYPEPRSIFEKTGEFIHLNNGYKTMIEVNDYRAYISYPVQISAVDIQEIIFSSTPLILAIVCVLTFIGSGIYTYLYQKEKKKLDILFNMMQSEVAYEKIKKINSMIYLEDYLKIEAQVLDLYQQLQTSQRDTLKEMQVVKQLEKEKKALLEGFTHEMKTPIMASQLLLANIRESELSNSQQEQLLAAEKELKKLQYLIRDVLFVFHNNQANKYTKIAISAVVTQLIAEYEVLWKDKALTIDLKKEEEFFIFYNRKLTEKVFSNLISNAIIYSPNNSRIEIRIGEKEIMIQNEVVGNKTIDVSEIDKPFFTYREDSGSGIGLYLVSMMLKHSKYKYQFSCDRYFRVKIVEKNSDPRE